MAEPDYADHDGDLDVHSVDYFLRRKGIATEFHTATAAERLYELESMVRAMEKGMGDGHCVNDKQRSLVRDWYSWHGNRFLKETGYYGPGVMNMFSNSHSIAWTCSCGRESVDVESNGKVCPMRCDQPPEVSRALKRKHDGSGESNGSKRVCIKLHEEINCMLHERVWIMFRAMDGVKAEALSATGSEDMPSNAYHRAQLMVASAMRLSGIASIGYQEPGLAWTQNTKDNFLKHLNSMVNVYNCTGLYEAIGAAMMDEARRWATET